MHKVLIIEDDPIIGEMLVMYLSEENYDVIRVSEGNEAMLAFKTFEPDVVLLDLLLPDMDGIDLGREIREISDVPILVVSMKTEVSERILALRNGVDDYLCKPFSMQELTARIDALIRRAGISRQPREESISPPLTGSIQLDNERRAVFVNDRFIETTFSEFEIMKLFHANPGRVYSREELIKLLRGFDSFVTERAIDVHIANLRKKLEDDPRKPHYIRTVWGIGYKFQS